MHVHLWLHSESLPPTWRAAELKRIEDYAHALRAQGAQVTYGHPLAPLPPRNSYIHIFGSGHWETIHWLRPHCEAIWLSPFSHSTARTEFSPPESALTYGIKRVWRSIFSPGAKRFSSRSALQIPEKFFCEEWAKVELLKWGVSRNKIFALPTGHNPE